MYSLLRNEGQVVVEAYEGFDLCGNTIGVVGTGNIGRRVIEIAKGFRMNVLGFDVYPNEALVSELGFTYISLEELLAQSDVVTLHVPATPENFHLINSDRLSTMKSNALLINTARGTLIDTVALLNALKIGNIRGAGLDVYEGEAYLADEMKLLSDTDNFDKDAFRAFVAEHELLDMPNVIMTPHMAFNTKEAKCEITETTISNIAAALNGAAQNVVHSS